MASAVSRLQRRIDPHQDAEHHREYGGADREFQRRRHPLHQQVRDRLAELIGDAELELRGVAEIAGELHRHGIVEAERFADRGALGGRRIDRDDLVDRIAGEAEHRERDDPDRDHDADGLDSPAKSESEHVILSLLFRCGVDWRCRQPETKSPGSAKLPGPGVEAAYSCLVAQ